MADVRYNQGVQEVAPTADAGTPFQTGRGAEAGAFGADIGQGVEKIGQGLLTSGKFFGKVAADNASNDFQDWATKKLHGDPSVNVPGPDGQPMPDTGYLGLKGRAALDARPGLSTAIEDKIKEIRSTLQTPEQQQEFDNFSRRYRVGVVEKVGSHADSQASSWYSSVNTATAKLAADHIANNYDNPAAVAAGASDLISSYVKNAQIKSGTMNGPEVQEAEAEGRRAALTAQLNAMAVKDPARALAVLDKNKNVAGISYDNLATQYRTRAQAQQGKDIGEQTLRATYNASPAPIYREAQLTNAGAPYGVSGGYLQRVHQLENPSNVTTVNSAGAAGPFQFIPATAKRYGLKDPQNFEQSADAAARLAADNRAAMAQTLGYEPTDAQLYLAHQQGSAGAAALLANPNISAAEALMQTAQYRGNPGAAAAAIRQNGGDPSAPASAFTSMWTAKFNGAPGMANQARKAMAFQRILENPDLTPEVRQHALTYVNQQITAQTVAEEQDAKAKKARNDQVHADLSSDIIQGKTENIVNRIAHSGLTGPEQQALYSFAVGAGGVEATSQFGPGYTSTFARVLAAENDPSRIVNPTDIIRMGPGGTGELTKRGVAELMSTMTTIKKQPDQAGISTVKAKQLKYYENQFGKDQSFLGPGMPPFANPKGENLFNHEFVPAYEAAYSKWIGEGKDPMTFLSDPKIADAIMDRIYPPSQRNADSISAGNGESGPIDKTVPPIPDGVETASWARLMKAPPNKADGKPWSMTAWAEAINRLRADPQPKTIKAFNDKFYLSGYTAEDILKRAPVPQKVEPGKPGVPVNTQDDVVGMGIRG